MPLACCITGCIQPAVLLPYWGVTACYNHAGAVADHGGADGCNPCHDAWCTMCHCWPCQARRMLAVAS